MLRICEKDKSGCTMEDSAQEANRRSHCLEIRSLLEIGDWMRGSGMERSKEMKIAAGHD